MNNRGQALVEFILVVPIFIIILISIIDVSNIYMKKYELEKNLDTVINLYKSEDTVLINKYANENDFKYYLANKDEMIKITIKKDLKINAPILNRIIGKTYTIETSKLMYKDSKKTEIEKPKNNEIDNTVIDNNIVNEAIQNE